MQTISAKNHFSLSKEKNLMINFLFILDKNKLPYE